MCQYQNYKSAEKHSKQNPPKGNLLNLKFRSVHSLLIFTRIVISNFLSGKINRTITQTFNILLYFLFFHFHFFFHQYLSSIFISTALKFLSRRMNEQRGPNVSFFSFFLFSFFNFYFNFLRKARHHEARIKRRESRLFRTCLQCRVCGRYLSLRCIPVTTTRHESQGIFIVRERRSCRVKSGSCFAGVSRSCSFTCISVV